LKALFAIFPVFATNTRRIFIKVETSARAGFSPLNRANLTVLTPPQRFNGPFTMGH